MFSTLTPLKSFPFFAVAENQLSVREEEAEDRDTAGLAEK